MAWIDLSHFVTTGMAQYPGDQRPVRLIRESEHASDGWLTTSLEIGCHVGTHLDAPLHARAGAVGVDALPLDRCAGWARVVDAAGPSIGPAALVDGCVPGVEFLIFRTGWSRHWGTPRYYAAWPALTPDLARILADMGLKGVGIDAPSLDRLGERACHDICAAAGMVNFENLAHLDALPARPFWFLALPLPLTGAEASPVRAAALVDGFGSGPEEVPR